MYGNDNVSMKRKLCCIQTDDKNIIWITQDILFYGSYQFYLINSAEKDNWSKLKSICTTYVYIRDLQNQLLLLFMQVNSKKFFMILRQMIVKIIQSEWKLKWFDNNLQYFYVVSITEASLNIYELSHSDRVIAIHYYLLHKLLVHRVNNTYI